MQVHVWNNLSAGRADVHREFVPGEIFLRRDFFCHEKKFPKKFKIFRGHFVRGDEIFFRHDQNVRFCFWRDVAEREHVFSFKNFVAGNFSGDDFFKNIGVEKRHFLKLERGERTKILGEK